MTDCSRVASDATPFEQSCLGPPLMPRLNLCWKHSLLPKSVFMRQILESGRRRVLRAREYGEQGGGAVLRPPAPAQHAIAVVRQYLQCLKPWKWVQCTKGLFYGTAQARVLTSCSARYWSNSDWVPAATSFRLTTASCTYQRTASHSFREQLVPILSFTRVSTCSSGSIRKGQRCTLSPTESTCHTTNRGSRESLFGARGMQAERQRTPKRTPTGLKSV